jgi:hypothetical protein
MEASADFLDVLQNQPLNPERMNQRKKEQNHRKVCRCVERYPVHPLMFFLIVSTLANPNVRKASLQKPKAIPAVNKRWW